jgi:hypothetical protein
MRKHRSARLLIVTLCLAVWASAAERLWWDGTRESDSPPPGRLLSDNDGYWGPCVLTGVEYSYARPPDSPADTWRDRPERVGRRLLDGRTVGNWCRARHWMSSLVSSNTP